MSEALIELKNIYKKYGKGTKKFYALDDVSIKVTQGRVSALLGPNGAGKTTMIKLILGLIKPSKGELNLFGSKKMTRKLKEKVGFLPEESYLYPFLTIRETLEFTSGLFQNKKDNLKRIPEILDLVGLSGFQTRKISECSKGMARRTAFAQAIINDPEFVILDEPTSGYDPIGTAEVKSIIKKLRDRGKTILLCSHQLADVEEVCDDIILIYSGKIVSAGPMKDLVNHEGRQGLSFAYDDLGKINQLISREEIKVEEVSLSRLEEYFISKISEISKE